MNMDTIKEIDVKSVMTKSSLPVGGYSVNPYVGCPHACRYCYASFMKRFTGHTEPWGTFLDVKNWKPITNPHKYDGERVVIGSVTDGYNPYEEEFHRTRRLLEELRGSDAEIMICTKSDLVLRDLDLLKSFPKVTVSWSVNTLDEQFCADMDNAVSIERRLKAMRQTYEAGIRTVCFVSPIFPRITDVKAIIEEVNPEQEELYRRMVFNVMSRNHDDHSKNLSFLMDRQGKWKLAPAYDLCYSYTPGGKWTNRHQLSLNGKQDNFTMEDLQKVGENMGIRKHKQIIEEIQETVSHWHETAKDCGVKPEHADFIGENLLLFGKQLHTIHMPDIANEQEQAFMKAMRNDDFNTILKLKMRGYQPSENTLKSLQPDVSATTFIAAAKIFQMEGMLKSLQDIKPAQSPITGGNKRSMEFLE